MSITQASSDASVVPFRGTRAESLRLQLADEIVRGELAPG